MDKERTIKKVVEKVERASTTFEKANTELKRKYLKWNIEVFNIKRTNKNLIGAPKINYIEVDNYQGTIKVSSLFANKIIWFLDGIKIKTKYNVIGEFVTTLKVENLYGKEICFILLGDNGQTKSKAFGLLPQEVL